MTATRIPLDVKVGDQVLFAKYAGTEFKLDDEELLILSEKDILAIVSRRRRITAVAHAIAT